MLSTEQATADATTPIKPHIATTIIVARAKNDTFEFCVNTARISMRMEHFDRASAMYNKIWLVKKY